MLIKILHFLFLLKYGLGQDTISLEDHSRCTQHNFILDCRSQNLIDFPMNIEEFTIEAINLNENGITHIHKIPEIPGLHTLVLTNNKIKKLSYDAFDNLSDLKTLSISNNSLSTISDDVFEWNPIKLEVLHLDGNQLEFIPQYLFYDLEQLTELQLQNNVISYIHPHAFLQLKALRNLRLDGNKLHTFDPVWIEKLQPNLFQLLRFDNNDWSCDCAMIYAQTWLEMQTRSQWFNDLTIWHPIKCTLPPKFKNKLLVNLKKGELESECEIPNIAGISSPVTLDTGRDVLLRCVVDSRRLPLPTISWTAPNKDVFRLNNAMNYDGVRVHQDGSLLITNISRNDNGPYSCTASNVKGSVVASTKLIVRRLLPSNYTVSLLPINTEAIYPENITIVPENKCPGGCVCLSRRIDCSGGGRVVKELPGNIPKDAIAISFVSNSLTQLGRRLFSNFSDLEELRLDRNSIFTIDTQAFEGLGALTTLTIQGNELTHIKKWTFSSLRNLNVLVLDKNKLTMLDDALFQGLDSLQWLYIRSNRIKTISLNAFAPLQNIRYIHIESNEIRTLHTGTVKALTTKAVPTIKKIFLNENAFKCDDKMEEMRLFVRNKNNSINFPNIFGDGIRCTFPSKYFKTYLHEIGKKLTTTCTTAQLQNNYNAKKLRPSWRQSSFTLQNDAVMRAPKYAGVLLVVVASYFFTVKQE